MWRPIAPLLRGRSNASAVVLGDGIYLCGGDTLVSSDVSSSSISGSGHDVAVSTPATRNTVTDAVDHYCPYRDAWRRAPITMSAARTQSAVLAAPEVTRASTSTAARGHGAGRQNRGGGDGDDGDDDADPASDAVEPNRRASNVSRPHGEIKRGSEDDDGVAAVAPKITLYALGGFQGVEMSTRAASGGGDAESAAAAADTPPPTPETMSVEVAVAERLDMETGEWVPLRSELATPNRGFMSVCVPAVL